MIGHLIKGGAEGIGNAVSEVVGTIWGSERDRNRAVHDEQMAVLAQFAAEFAGRPPKSKWDSFVDGLNRLPRPVITITVVLLMPAWAMLEPVTFTESMLAIQLIPDALWAVTLTIIAFWFGGRFVAQDIRRPMVAKQQLQLARELAARRDERAKEEARRRQSEQPRAARFPSPVAAPREASPGPDTDDTAAAALASEPPAEPASSDPDAIDRMIADLLKREGGYVNHPADKGGPTNWGITLATLSAWRGDAVTATDVKALDRSEAADIYRATYYFGPGIDRLPQDLQAHVFDIGVNCGPRTGIRLLQRAVNRLGGPQLKEDGVLGPATEAAAAAHPAAEINEELVGVRLKYYQDIVARNPRQKVFIKGWSNRARSFMPT